MQPVHLLLIFSALFTFLGFVQVRKAKRLTRTGTRAIATVIRNRYSTDSDGDATYIPVVEFFTADRKTITLELSFGNLVKPARIGKKVEVIYNPANPAEAEVNSFFRLVVGPWLFILLGLAGVVLASLDMLHLTNIFLTGWATD